MKILKDAGIDVRSKHTAIETASNIGNDPTRYRKLICGILDIEKVDIPDREVKHTLLYLIDQIFNDTVTDLDLQLAHTKAKALIKKLPQILTRESVKSNAPGGKGHKKQLALSLYREYEGEIENMSDWVELFMNEIDDMKKATAKSYIHNILTGKWEP